MGCSALSFLSMRRRRASPCHRSACSSPSAPPPLPRGARPPISRARAAAIAAIPLAHTFTGLLALNGLIGIVGAVVPAALSARLAAVTTPAQSVVAMGGPHAAADAGVFVGPGA